MDIGRKPTGKRPNIRGEMARREDLLYVDGHGAEINFDTNDTNTASSDETGKPHRRYIYQKRTHIVSQARLSGAGL